MVTVTLELKVTWYNGTYIWVFDRTGKSPKKTAYHIKVWDRPEFKNVKNGDHIDVTSTGVCVDRKVDAPPPQAPDWAPDLLEGVILIKHWSLN